MDAVLFSHNVFFFHLVVDAAVVCSVAMYCNVKISVFRPQWRQHFQRRNRKWKIQKVKNKYSKSKTLIESERKWFRWYRDECEQFSYQTLRINIMESASVCNTCIHMNTNTFRYLSLFLSLYRSISRCISIRELFPFSRALVQLFKMPLL